jgi:Tfp pilus assembly protein PilN
MSGTIGVELTTLEIRAVRLRPIGGGVARSTRIAWDPSRPQAAIAELHSTLGGATQLAVAIGLGFLELKRVDLPPAPLAERERMLQLEPERFFAAGGAALLTALDEASGIAFAAPRDAVAAWVAALESWAPVERVEATPVAVARVLDSNGSYVLDGGGDPSASGVLEIREHRLHAARRLAAQADRNGARPIPPRDGVPDLFHAAWGAARGVHGPLTGTLATTELRATVAQRRRRVIWGLAVAAVAAVTFAGWAFERYQERELASLARAAGTLAANATPALQAQGRLLALGTEIAALRAVATTGPQPLIALAALSETLPRDANLTSARMQGDEWQIEGTARDVSRLVPLLDKSGHFENVRSVAATSRFNDRGTVRESFSIALRVRHAP